MVRRTVGAAALLALAGAWPTLDAAPQERQPAPPVYADAVAVKRIRDALVALPPTRSVLVPLKPSAVTFKVQVFGAKPFIPSFEEWLAAEVTGGAKAPAYSPSGTQMGGFDVLPLFGAAVAKYRQHRAEHVRKQVAEELEQFLRTHPPDPR